jgi:hypothetical protein
MQGKKEKRKRSCSEGLSTYREGSKAGTRHRPGLERVRIGTHFGGQGAPASHLSALYFTAQAHNEVFLRPTELKRLIFLPF